MFHLWERWRAIVFFIFQGAQLGVNSFTISPTTPPMDTRFWFTREGLPGFLASQGEWAPVKGRRVEQSAMAMSPESFCSETASWTTTTSDSESTSEQISPAADVAGATAHSCPAPVPSAEVEHYQFIGIRASKTSSQAPKHFASAARASTGSKKIKQSFKLKLPMQRKSRCTCGCPIHQENIETRVGVSKKRPCPLFVGFRAQPILLRGRPWWAGA